MPAGNLDERVTFERSVRVPDGGGGWTETWTTVATVHAQVEPLSGREALQAQALGAPANYRVTIRRRDDVMEADRIKWRGHIMNIRYIARTGRELYMRIDAEMGVA